MSLLNFTVATVLAVSMPAGAAYAADANKTSVSEDEAAISAVMAQYNEALNASSTEGCLKLYAEDGVFMPSFSQSAVGITAVRQAYQAVFKAVTLHVQFKIAEIIQMSPNWALVRTNSSGTNRINATGAVSSEGNQELFVFKKEASGQWKIFRYSFSPTSAPKA